MKNLILVLFAILTFSFGINAQDLSYKTFNQTIKPKGELFAKFEDTDTALYVYNEWEEYSITQWQVTFNKSANEVWELKKYKFFYDEINHAFNSVEVLDKRNHYGQTSVKLQGKESKFALLTKYSSDSITDYGTFIGYFYAQNETQAQSFIEKLKEKAFDMSLDLDSKVERFTVEGKARAYDDVRVYNGEYPKGISAAEWTAMQRKREAEQNAGSESKDTGDDDETTTTKTNTNSTNNSASNNSAPKEKTEIRLKLWNKSEGIIEIRYEERGAGGSRIQTSINSRSTKSVKMKIGGRVFGANGAVLLTVTADMEDTSQVIFQ